MFGVNVDREPKLLAPDASEANGLRCLEHTNARSRVTARAAIGQRTARTTSPGVPTAVAAAKIGCWPPGEPGAGDHR